MFDEPQSVIRARGAAHLSVKQRGAFSTLAEFRQQGSLKVLFPRSAQSLEAVLLNTAGGVTGGDSFEVDLAVEKDARLSVSTQAAERIYKAASGQVGNVCVTADLAEGARLDWVPQETILFDESAVRREISVSLAKDAAFLAVEPVVLGRAAMGETVRQGFFNDQWRVRRAGKLIFANATRLDGDLHAQMARVSVGDGAIAFATVLLAAPNAGSYLARMRSLMTATSGVSLVREGVLVANFLAESSFALRRDLIPVIELLRGCEIPKVWRL